MSPLLGAGLAYLVVIACYLLAVWAARSGGDDGDGD